MGKRGLYDGDRAVINRTSAVPLHTQLRTHLLRRIERGELRQGQKLPSEREYADQLGISLAPVRQAILDLVKEGYLNRTRGRGTFGQEGKVEEKIAILSSFTQSLRAKGLDPDIRIWFRGLVAATGAVARALQTRERRLLLIRRLAVVEGEPAALLGSYPSPPALPVFPCMPSGQLFRARPGRRPRHPPRVAQRRAPRRASVACATVG